MKMFLTKEKNGYLQEEMDRTIKTLRELKALIKDRASLNEVIFYKCIGATFKYEKRTRKSWKSTILKDLQMRLIAAILVLAVSFQLLQMTLKDE